MPFFTVLLHEITTTSNNFNPNEFNWGEIMSNIEIATKRGIQIFIEFQEKSTKKSLVENLDDLLSFFEQYCKEISIDHTPVSKVMRNHIREMKKNLLSK